MSRKISATQRVTEIFQTETIEACTILLEVARTIRASAHRRRAEAQAAGQAERATED